MIFHRFDGIVLDRGDYIVVRTPSNPGFFFGNLLIFPDAPQLGSLKRWKELFRKEFSETPAVKHFTFLWDDPAHGLGDVTELGMEGFKVDFSVVLTARSVHQPAKSNDQVEVLTISTDQQWKEVTEAQIASKSAEFGEASYRQFKEQQMARYRSMSESGLGHWFGAYLNGRLVADLGVYREEKLGRFRRSKLIPTFVGKESAGGWCTKARSTLSKK